MAKSYSRSEISDPTSCFSQMCLGNTAFGKRTTSKHLQFACHPPPKTQPLATCRASAGRLRLLTSRVSRINLRQPAPAYYFQPMQPCMGFQRLQASAASCLHPAQPYGRPVCAPTFVKRNACNARIPPFVGGARGSCQLQFNLLGSLIPAGACLSRREFGRTRRVWMPYIS